MSEQPFKQTAKVDILLRSHSVRITASIVRMICGHT